MPTKKTRTRATRESEPPVAQVTPAPPNEAGVSLDTAFPVVGIGASAGGLAAFEAFFSGMPVGADPGMAFVLVQHLAPDHKSILSDLVKRYTSIQVFEVEDGMRVQVNCAYIIPPNRDMALLDGTLQLLEPTAPRGQRLPIDFFFRSLAQDQHERAICIVLSGTGSDGTLGARAVKGEGGMVMAQNPESTEYDGMPRSVIGTGVVDYVLPPAEMPQQLMAYGARAFGKAPRQGPSSDQRHEDDLKKLFILLRAQTGHDFSQYKRNTVVRRVDRRMAVHQVERLSDYVRYLQQTPSELDALFRDLLIGVTSFFRDPKAFAALQALVIPLLLAGKPPGATIRAWVPGCSTGEEAYSIAILLLEQIESLKKGHTLQIFATDIDRHAIEQARSGVFPASISADVSAERLARYFTRDPDGSACRIKKHVRDALVFSEQDVVRDPPFSKLDLISCRNLLIYMGPELQQKLIPLFHYALSPGGALMLGTSETVGAFMDLFSPLDVKQKLYQRTETAFDARRAADGAPLSGLLAGRAMARPVREAAGERKAAVRDLAERALLTRYAPSGALVDEHGDILYLHGRTGQYLEPAPGESGMNILTMAREGLRRTLSVALQEAAASRETMRHPAVRVRTNGDFVQIDLAVQPVPTGRGAFPDRSLFLVTFEESSPPAAAAPVPAGSVASTHAEPVAEGDARVAALMNELRTKEEHLQTSNEELETSNEELKSSNEEMQSVNEELQSTNEELETSKEELQSVNEELATVNVELQQKVTDLSRVNNDMNNLLAGTGVGTIFVDHRLHIQRFTPAVTQVINLIQTDVGRPVGHIVSNLVGYDRLVQDIREVLDSLIPREVEVQTVAGVWYLLRIRPYRTLENVIEGAVVTFVDITEMKAARAALRDSTLQRRLAVVVRDSSDAILVQDLDGRITAWNKGAERLYGWSEAEALTMNVRDLVPEEQREAAREVVRKLARADVLASYRTQRLSSTGHVVDVWLTASPLVDDAGGVYAIATTERRAEGTRP
jgi:two-component system CheB/CheR fusion protein